ncbi:hypothetical protein JY440_01865 [Stenotrophomonas maltophilia]|uniref:DUF1801 domain-containing protein n=1 Tax=Stenotrophomonas maltophilia TaxID=40324 RepID=A0AB34TC39_STEMA|nr:MULTISPECIES: hypothetical protein [Stenotrophomonas]KOO70075.1 hypothetical protein VL23_20530 [Stenotrophomonas maltophilia]KOQ79670.1 hypothetical protein ABW45_00860 [Stenotrophomonas maltophilia]MBN4981974.1 hypothetical protein [Stenotrophomonas maltophilia]MDQ7300536.1 hypothetical protein [Stenotrophomonas sp. Sm2017]
MTAPVDFTAKCFGANLRLTRDSDSSWRISLYTFVGKNKTLRNIAFACTHPGKVPRVVPPDADADTPAALWLGSAAFDLPDTLAPKIQAFLAEHAKGGAA